MDSILVGHEKQVQQFRERLARQRLASTFLLTGPDGIGKRTFAYYVAQCLLCEATPEDALEACQQCSACQQVIARTHPDLLLVERPAEKNFIPIDRLIGERDQRMRAGLCHDIALKPFRGGRRIAIIDDADFLNQEGANCLLKTLEEPPPRSVIFLLSTSEHRQLATIRSRAQTVRFSPLSQVQVTKIIKERNLLEDSPRVSTLAAASQGSVLQALRLAEEEVFDFRVQWLKQLATLDPGQERFYDTLSEFIDAAGKDSAKKRDRFRMVVDWAIEFYNQLTHQCVRQECLGGDDMVEAVRTAAANWQSDLEQLALLIERCHRVHREIVANANQALSIECWLSDLGQIARSELTDGHHAGLA